MTVFCGDNFALLKKIPSSSVDMIYMDPPFFTQKTHKLSDKSNNFFSFEDSWDSIETYKLFLEDRILECKRILKDTGTIFVHCDKTANHHIRSVLDEVFGPEMFQSEIIWNYKRWSNSKKGLLNNHQNIYFYSKTANFKFNTIFTEYSSTTNLDQILVERQRNKGTKTVYKVDEEGNYILAKEKKGVPLSDVWEIPFLNPKARERTGYPTQKPILLMEQIIKISTDEGDVVLDPFCGSGTTLVAAKLLQRQFIGMDISEEAILLTKKRLQELVKTTSNLLDKGIDSYKNKTEYEENILKLFKAKIVQRNRGIDGFLPRYLEEKPVPIKIQRENESLYDSISLLKQAMAKKNLKQGIVIRTHNDSLLFEEDDMAGNILIIDHFELSVESWLKLNRT